MGALRSNRGRANLPILFMLVGIPGSGKSTWAQKYINNLPSNEWVIASSDSIIEELAKVKGTTYTEEFKINAKYGIQECIKSVQQAISLEKNIIWDQTNLTKKSRAAKLALFPESYSKYYYRFETPEPEELEKRLASRPDKFIPQHVIESMISSLEEPSLEEGFLGYIV